MKDVKVINENVWVIKRYEIASVVSRFLNREQANHLDLESIESIYSRLYPFTQLDEVAKEQHIQNIRKMSDPKVSVVPEKEQFSGHQTMNTQVCPKCGGQLILRTARKGAHAGNQFWGCANYPKCKYIKNL